MPDEVFAIRIALDEGLGEMRQGFATVERRFNGVEQRLDGVEQRLDGVDRRFDSIDQRLDGLDRSFEELKRHVTVLIEDVRDDIRIVAEGYGALNTKIDRLVDRLDGPRP